MSLQACLPKGLWIIHFAVFSNSHCRLCVGGGCCLINDVPLHAKSHVGKFRKSILQIWREIMPEVDRTHRNNVPRETTLSETSRPEISSCIAVCESGPLRAVHLSRLSPGEGICCPLSVGGSEF